LHEPEHKYWFSEHEVGAAGAEADATHLALHSQAFSQTWPVKQSLLRLQAGTVHLLIPLVKQIISELLHLKYEQ